MAPKPVTLHVPPDPPLRSVAGGVAGRYFELCGGEAAGATTFSGDVQRAVDAVPAGSSADVALTADAAGVDAVVSGGGRTTRVRTDF